MKQPFVNATMNDRRKGREALAQTAQPHPARPTAISSSDALLPTHRLPVKVAPKVKIEQPPSDLEAMKMEILKAMRAVEKTPRSVPKSKLIGMAAASAKEEPVRDYNDILAMLLAKK
jgi:cell envelope opacity-associated protein A